MFPNLQHANAAALRKSSETLIDAHQAMINAWYAVWLSNQRERAAEVLKASTDSDQGHTAGSIQQS